MFIVSAKLTRATLAWLAVAGGVVLCLLILLAASLDRDRPLTLETEQARLDFLSSLGWRADPYPECDEVVIPEVFSQVYREYNELQLAQGFDLSHYAGQTVTRYCYDILNFDERGAQAVLLLYRGRLIGGDVHSLRLDGAMVGLLPGA